MMTLRINPIFQLRRQRMAAAVSLLAAWLLSSGLAGCKEQEPTPDGGKDGIELHIGEGINFQTGKVTKLAAEADIVFQYLPPQSPHGWRYNPITGQFDYVVNLETNENYPLLHASRIAAFDRQPNPDSLTVGDVNGWLDEAYDIGPGRHLLVRGLTDGKHYRVSVLKLSAPSQDPGTWTISLSYEPVELQLGVAGSAGKNMALQGTLTYREFIHTKKIIDLNLANGQVAERFDGFGISRNQQGLYAYVKNSSEICLADAGGNVVATLPAPPSAPKSYSYDGPTEAILSPDGQQIAVQVERAQNITVGEVSVPGVPQPTVVVIDRSGQELGQYFQHWGATWLPDGELAMAATTQAVITVAEVGTSRTQIIRLPVSIETVSSLAVSPDGHRIAFSGNNRIFLIGTDGSGLKQLTQSGRSELTPAWSPDGKHVAFQQADPTTTTDDYWIAVHRLADGKTTIVTDAWGNTREPSGRMFWVGN